MTPFIQDPARILKAALEENGMPISAGSRRPYPGVVSPPVPLPTADACRQLPRWARVAYAARCARRVLPLARFDWADLPDDLVGGIEQAVQEIERGAAAGRFTPVVDHFELVACASMAYEEATDARSAVVAAWVARAVHYAFALAVRAAAAAGSSDKRAWFDRPDRTLLAAASALWDAGMTVAVGRLTADFEAVRGRAAVESWTDETPVPPETFGPLWPDGLPPGWPVPTPAAVGSAA